MRDIGTELLRCAIDRQLKDIVARYKGRPLDQFTSSELSREIAELSDRYSNVTIDLDVTPNGAVALRYFITPDVENDQHPPMGNQGDQS